MRDVSGTIDGTVLDAVARILDRHGVAGLNISAIAAEAGLSRVTLHRRGAGLDDYLVAVLGRVSDDLRSSLWPAMTGAGPAAERFAAALRTLCEVCERHAGVMSAMFGHRPRPLPGRPSRTTSFEFIEPFERLLRDGNVDGSLHSADPLPDATIAANMVCWTYLHMRQAHRWDAETAANHIVPAAVARLLPG